MYLMTTMLAMVLAGAPGPSVPSPILTISPSANYGTGQVAVQAGQRVRFSVEVPGYGGEVILWAVQLSSNGEPRLETLMPIGKGEVEAAGETSWAFKIPSALSGESFQVVAVVRDHRGISHATAITTIHFVPWPPLIVTTHPFPVN